MLSAIIGLPGSGKSYEAVRYHIIPAIKEGRKVITNVPLNVEWFIENFGDNVVELIECKEMGAFHDKTKERPFSSIKDFITDEWRNDKEQGPLFVVDEAHLIYPTSGRGKLQSQNLQDCLDYFSGHRHYGHDIVLMTQHLRKLNAHVRDMIEIQYKLGKHTALGSSKSYTQHKLDGTSRKSTEIDSCNRFYDSKYFGAYKSHTQSEGSVKEAGAADIKPIWKRPRIVLPFLLLPFCIWYVASNIQYWMGGRYVNQEENIEQVEESTQTSTEGTETVTQKSAPTKPASNILGVYEFEGSIKKVFPFDDIKAIYLSSINTVYYNGYKVDDLVFKVVTEEGHYYISDKELGISDYTLTQGPSGWSSAIIDDVAGRFRISYEPTKEDKKKKDLAII